MKLLIQVLIVLFYFVHDLWAMQLEGEDFARGRSVSDAELMILKKSAVCCLIGCYKVQKYHEAFKITCNSFCHLSCHDKDVTSNSILCCLPNHRN